MKEFIDFSLLFQCNIVSIVFWLVAIGISILYGVNGWQYLDECKESKNPKKTVVEKLTDFVSEFLLSMIGWVALYVFIARLMIGTMTGFDVFLGIVAIAGISGFGFRIEEWLKKAK